MKWEIGENIGKIIGKPNEQKIIKWFLNGRSILKSISDFSPWSADCTYGVLLFSTFRYIVSKSVLSALGKLAWIILG